MVTIGLVEIVVERRIDPHPAAVLASAPAAHVLRATRGEHREPALDGPSLVFGMEMVEHVLADHLLGRISEHLREGLVAVQHVCALVLDQGAEARRGASHLLLGAVVALATSSPGISTHIKTP